MLLSLSCHHQINPHLHSEPVSLCALESMGELEAVHLQHVEEGVAHYVGDAVLGLHQTAVEPNNTVGYSKSPQQMAMNTLLKEDGTHLLSQSQWDMVKMLLLKMPYLM